MQNAKDSQALQNGQGQSGLKRFATKFCVSITLAVGLLAAGECVLYFLLPPQVRSPSDYKAFVIWETVRPVFKIVTVDSEGLRQTQHSHCEAGAYTIWMFGGSSMWGHVMHDWETIPSQVAKHYEESGHPVCVKNYGQEAWVNTQEVIKLMLLLKRVEKIPDAVIFYDGTNEAFLPYESDEVDAHWGFPRFKNKFESWKFGEQRGFEYIKSTNTYLGLQWAADKLQLVHNTAAPRMISAEQAAPMAMRALDNYSKNMEIVDLLAAHYGFHYDFFWEPYLPYSRKPLTAAEESLKKVGARNYPGLEEVMRATYDRVSAVKSPHFVFLGDLLNDHRETLFKERDHLNPEGNHLVAERICQVLQLPGS